MDTHAKTAVITGVSTGIGHATAQMLLEKGWHVFGSVRKAADAKRLAGAHKTTFTPLVFDVTDQQAIAQAASQVADALDGRTLDGLVNNAGIAVSGPLRHIPIDEVALQLDVNVLGVLRVCQAFTPLLGADRARSGSPGKIIHIGSIAGKVALPLVGAYAMSKHALEALSDSLRRELMLYGIDVVLVGPGAVKTPIWGKTVEMNVNQYKGTDYYDILRRLQKNIPDAEAAGLEPEAIARVCCAILATRKPKTRYAVTANKLLNWILPRLMPARWLDRAVARRMEFSDKT